MVSILNPHAFELIQYIGGGMTPSVGLVRRVRDALPPKTPIMARLLQLNSAVEDVNEMLGHDQMSNREFPIFCFRDRYYGTGYSYIEGRKGSWIRDWCPRTGKPNEGTAYAIVSMIP
jgi:hypothetical protein